MSDSWIWDNRVNVPKPRVRDDHDHLDRHLVASRDEMICVALVAEAFARVQQQHPNWYLARRIAQAASRVRRAG